MSIRSEIDGHKSGVTPSLDATRTTFPCEAIPYLVSTADALMILLASLLGAVVYHQMTDTPVPDLTAYFALGLIASFIHIARQGGRGYYDFERVAKPGVEVAEVLICWLTTILLLAFFAFLFKIGISFSRGSFLVFMGVAPIGLLGGRKLSKHIVETAIARGAIGRRNTVLLGDPAELESLDDRDLLAMVGAGEVSRFMLSETTDPTLQETRDLKMLAMVANFVRQNNSSEILLSVPWHDAVRIDFLREQIKLLPVSVRILPDRQMRALTNYASSGGQRILSIEIQRAPLTTTERVVKRVNDLIRTLDCFDKRLAELAQTHQADGIICGHFHKPELHDLYGVTYANCGDWVENSTALAETDSGRLLLLDWAAHDKAAGTVGTHSGFGATAKGI